MQERPMLQILGRHFEEEPELVQNVPRRTALQAASSLSSIDVQAVVTESWLKRCYRHPGENNDDDNSKQLISAADAKDTASFV